MTQLAQQFTPNRENFRVLTDEGFVEFEGVAAMGVKPTYCVSFDDGTTITATASHAFFTLDERAILVGELEPGITLIGQPVDKTVVSVEFAGYFETYDVVKTTTGTFLSSGVVSHNCEFISNDPLLVDTVVLARLTEVTNKIRPIAKSGDVVFFELPKKDTTYLIAVDPSTGSGSDYTAMVAYRFPEMVQVAEFRSNTASSVEGYKILKRVLRVFDSAGAQTYYTVEANGVGEGMLALIEADEDQIDSAEFVSETGQKRSGMTTTGRSKMKGCLSLKDMIERDLITIKSRATIYELKHFVRRGGSFSAKINATDDLVMATVLVIRLLEEISSYDQRAYDKLFSHAYAPDSEAVTWDESEDMTGWFTMS